MTKDEETGVVGDQAMRTQMFNTMKAVETAARAFTGSADADNLRGAFLEWMNSHTSGGPAPAAPPITPQPPHDGLYRCQGCGYETFHKGGRRCKLDARDTCQCSLAPPTPTCSSCNGSRRITVDKGDSEDCPDCRGTRHRDGKYQCSRCNGAVVIESGARAGNYDADTCTCGDTPRLIAIDGRELKPASTVPTQTEAEKMRRAIALLTMKVFQLAAGEKDSFFSPEISDNRIYGLLGVKPCDKCKGTGWLAQDETCRKCKSRGWLSA